jgi:hypothetical protein
MTSWAEILKFRTINVEETSRSLKETDRILFIKLLFNELLFFSYLLKGLFQTKCI